MSVHFRENTSPPSNMHFSQNTGSGPDKEVKDDPGTDASRSDEADADAVRDALTQKAEQTLKDSRNKPDPKSPSDG